jgi:hypothetical protein
MHSAKAEKISYYNTTSVESVDFIELLKLPFSLGSAVKYIMRSNSVDPKTKDRVGELDKILYYLGREKRFFSYTETPSEYDALIQTTLVELQPQLNPLLFKGFYWICVYIACNKLTEFKKSKEGYLDRAMLCLVEYRDELEKENS